VQIPEGGVADRASQGDAHKQAYRPYLAPYHGAEKAVVVIDIDIGHFSLRIECSIVRHQTCVWEKGNRSRVDGERSLVLAEVAALRWVIVLPNRTAVVVVRAAHVTMSSTVRLCAALRSALATSASRDEARVGAADIWDAWFRSQLGALGQMP
jgi:hypothetical protein